MALKPTGLSMAQYSTLRALHEHPEASAAELARLCFVTRQSLQDVLAACVPRAWSRLPTPRRAGAPDRWS